ncbi:MAG: GNAT family N-acetyltransferase [Anaerolineaceae bacterium]|nr:GNAT family N-acetyltransferase [Anaerolineaceae bacterium]
MIVNQVETPNAGLEALIRQGLSRYNQEQVGNRDAQRLMLVANDKHDQVIGGVLGESIWGWLLVETIWVDEAFRGQGYGSELLARAEDVARQRGCTHVALETFSFQYLPFYQKRGYRVYGQLDGFPAGHTRYSLKKDLQAVVLPEKDCEPDHDALYHVSPDVLPDDEYIRFIYGVIIDLLNQRDVQGLLQRIVEHAASILNAPYSEIMLLEGDDLVVKAFTSNQKKLDGDRVRRGEAQVSWRAFDTHEPVVVDDYFAWSGKRVIYDDAQLRAVADFPVMMGSTCLGVLAMGRTEPNLTFTETDVYRGMQFAQLAAVVLDNVILHTSLQNEIDERYRTERALQASEAQLWSLLENTPAMTVRVDRDCAIQFIRVPGYNMDEIQPLIGQDYRQFVQEDHYEMACSAITAVFDEQQAVQYEVVGIDPQTGMTHWYLTHAAPIIEEGRVTAALLVNTDISERKQSQEKIQQQNDALAKINWELAIARKQAEAANRMKSRFLASITYELRVPLNAVIGYTQLQLTGMLGEITDEQRGFQERVLANAQHLLDLINDVLDLSRLEAGNIELVSEPFDLRECFTEIDQQNRTLAQNKGLALHMEVDHQLPEIIVGDRDRLKQIVVNLLSNAIKFTDQGEVRVSAALNLAKEWTIKVSDTGIGIPPNQQMEIFDEFRRIEEDEQRGGGLGLAITRKLVLLMGGTIMVQSEIDKGSHFTVTLRLEEYKTPNDLLH